MVIEGTAPGFEERSWNEFRATGLLWWVNRTLHLFGWVIVVEAETDGNGDYNVNRVYPSRSKIRGFTETSETRGFRKLTTYMRNEAEGLLSDLDKE